MLLLALLVVSHIDVAGMDKSVSPGDDLFVYGNGAWLKATDIPPDRSSFGTDAILADDARTRTQDLIKNAAASTNASGDALKIATYYATFMDDARIEALGMAPLRPALDEAAAIGDKTALARVLGASLRADVDPLNATNFVTGNLLGLWVAQGLDDSKHNAAYLLQGGLGLPDREYYLSDKPDMVALRTAYQAHVAAMLKLAGRADSDAAAAQVMAL
ncbi:MAG TPA: M13 family metallopeptidase N-terminal domain-containing protein, partial [Myxococcota bacterium]